MQTINEFTYFTNRASAVFDAALCEMGGKPFDGKQGRIDLLYFNTYGGKVPPEHSELGFTLIDRARTIPLDHKRKMAETLQLAGLNRPMVYFDVESLPQQGDRLWFVKNPLATAGKDLYCVKTSEVASVFKSGFIIQEAIEDIDLIDKRKYTLRAYVLVFRGQVYLFPEGVLVIHGKDYSADDKSAEAQFLHTGYASSESEVSMRPLSSHAHYRAVLKSLRSLVPRCFMPFKNHLLDGKDNTYCLFGIDVLVGSDFDAYLVEINDRPNLVHTRAINQAVSVPVVKAMMHVFDSARIGASAALSFEFESVLNLHEAEEVA